MEHHPEVARVLELLNTVLRLRKIRPGDLEDHFGLSADTIRRILSGGIELKYRMVIDLLKYLGITPALFFQIAYENPEEDTDLLAARLARVRPIDDVAVDVARLTRGDLQELIVDTLRELGVAIPQAGATATAPEPTTAARRRRTPTPKK